MDGAGPVEETLAKLMNESIFMVDNAEKEKPEDLDFYVPLDAAVASIQEKELSMLQNSIIKRMAVEEDEIDNNTMKKRKKKETFFITVDAVHVRLTFWIGFVSLKDAQHFKAKLSKNV